MRRRSSTWTVAALALAACSATVTIEDAGVGGGGAPATSAASGQGGSGEGGSGQGGSGQGGSQVSSSSAMVGGDGGSAEPPCVDLPASGDWTLLTAQAAAAMDPIQTKQYLYVAPNGRWYLSPPSTLNWDWSAYQAQEGTYTYCDGSTTGTFSCTSGEVGEFGVGCSNGPGPTFKTLPIYDATPAAGICEICQDQPNAFGGPVCQQDVVVSYRYLP